VDYLLKRLVKRFPVWDYRVYKLWFQWKESMEIKQREEKGNKLLCLLTIDLGTALVITHNKTVGIHSIIIYIFVYIIDTKYLYVHK